MCLPVPQFVDDVTHVWDISALKSVQYGHAVKFMTRVLHGKEASRP